ncbi:PASTA domain-containing protein [Actinocrispum wychmicini]|nr:PASTA domain-containing protein [Actinocrispum wychmicini]
MSERKSKPTGRAEAVPARLMVLTLLLAGGWLVLRYNGPDGPSIVNASQTTPSTPPLPFTTTSTPSPVATTDPATTLPVPTGQKSTTTHASTVAADTQVTVPMLLGLSERDARAALRQSGLAVGPLTHRQADQGLVGVVVDTTPPVGSSVRRGATIVLVLGASSHAPIAVPDLVGLTVEQATQKLRALGWTGAFDRSDTPTGDPSQAGRIFDQDPLPNSQLKPADPVRLRVYTLAAASTGRPGN